MQKIPVTAIIPCYACADTLGRALSSIQGQSAQPSSVILVLDGCPQDEQNRLYTIAEHYHLPFTIIQSRKNLGPGSARNLGWEQSATEYLAFLDADDSWHPNKLELQFQFMQANKQVIFCGHRPCLSRGQSCPAALRHPIEGRHVSLWQLLFSNCFLTSSVMIRSDIPQRFGPGRYSEDYLLWLEITASGMQNACLNNILAYQHKPSFRGNRGLSTQLWAMEKGEMQNYLNLYRKGLLTPWQLSWAMPWSLLKFFRRLLICPNQRKGKKDISKTTS